MLQEERHSAILRRSEVGWFSRRAVALANWSERWFPDALVFAWTAIVLIFAVAVCLGERPGNLVQDFGDGFWELIPFTLQMVMIIVGGYVVASAPITMKILRRLAAIPRTPRSAVAFIALVATTSSLVSWGFSLIFSALLVRQIVQNLREVDYRAASAAAYLGVGTVWALGLSSSAALMMASQGSIPRGILEITGRISLTETIFTWQSLTTAGMLITASVLVAYFSTPEGAAAKTAESFGVKFEATAAPRVKPSTPGEWLECKGILTVLICAMGFAYLAKTLLRRGPLGVLDLNTYNFFFILLGMLLHWTPRAFSRAVAAAVPATSGVLIQFPFYAGIFGLLTKSLISNHVAKFFVHMSTHGTYPLLVAIYSAFLGFFIPSGGSKWVIEAPYVLAAANQLHVNLGWVVQIYNAAEALPNLVNPFWMLPLLGLLNVRARDVVGYSSLYLIVNASIVLGAMWFFSRTLPYLPPALH